MLVKIAASSKWEVSNILRDASETLKVDKDVVLAAKGFDNTDREAVLARRAAVCEVANVSTEALVALVDEKTSRKQPMPMVPGVPPSPRFGHRHYPLALAWLDSGVGSVLTSLRAAGLESNTLTIFTSDHAAFDKERAWLHDLPQLQSSCTESALRIGAKHSKRLVHAIRRRSNSSSVASCRVRIVISRGLIFLAPPRRNDSPPPEPLLPSAFSSSSCN